MFDSYSNQEPAFYDTAQICLNGHLINDSSVKSPEHNKKFCTECSESTITQCPNCKTDIKGDYYVPGVICAGFNFPIPKHCHECGSMYPWTQRKIDEAKEFADEIHNLSKDEKILLKQSIENLVKKSSEDVAALRFKNLVTKAGKQTYEGLKSILINVLSEAVKKKMGL